MSRDTLRLGAALACLAAAPAMALDCGGRQDPAATAICGDSRALAADDRMAATYSALARAPGGPQREALLADQRDWLRRRDLTCLADAGKLVGAGTAGSCKYTDIAHGAIA